MGVALEKLCRGKPLCKIQERELGEGKTTFRWWGSDPCGGEEERRTVGEEESETAEQLLEHYS